MPDIVLTTLNARYAHAAFGLRYLMANLPPGLRGRAVVLEFDVNQRPTDVLEAILSKQPRIVGVGVYIWNVAPATQLVADLKRVRPDVLVVVGGPEVSHEVEGQKIVRYADHVVTGEADLAFGELCERLLNGRRPLQKVITADLPEFASSTTAARTSKPPALPGDMSGLDARVDPTCSPAEPGAYGCAAQRGVRLPYDLYTDEDLANRVVYVEASRGCPFKCEFCLSSLDVPVRNVPLDAFLSDMRRLLDRGLRRFKFVDRTFNLNLNTSRAILEFFLDRYQPGLFVHFEMIPDRLPAALRGPIARFPTRALQFEVGIQTFNPDVAALISRRQDYARLTDNLTWLREQTGVHVHADLIVGLPGEDAPSFGRGFDRLVALRPQEIQVGMLKRLRGTPIVRHDAEWAMVYSPAPPYEVLQTRLIDFATMQRMRRFARYWDLVANSGNFVETTPMLWRDGASPFESFLRLADWLHARTARTHGIALAELGAALLEFLSTERGMDAADVAQTLWQDWRRAGRGDRPAFLAAYVSDADARAVRRAAHARLPKRQSRHAGAVTDGTRGAGW